MASSLLISATTWSTYTQGSDRSVQQALSDAAKGFASSFRSLAQVSNTISGLWAAASIALGLFGVKLLWTTPVSRHAALRHVHVQHVRGS